LIEKVEDLESEISTLESEKEKLTEEQEALKESLEEKVLLPLLFFITFIFSGR